MQHFLIRGRRNFFEESFRKLRDYIDALNLKKQQRSEMLTNERSGGLNFLKIGNQSSRNPAELVNQKVEDRIKNGIMSRRVRSSVAEVRVCNCNFCLHSLSSSGIFDLAVSAVLIVPMISLSLSLSVLMFLMTRSSWLNIYIFYINRHMLVCA